jgi:hypothetical protein
VNPNASGHHLRVPDTIRRYSITTIYICVAIMADLLLLIWDRLDGPTPSVCPRGAAALLTGSWIS